MLMPIISVVVPVYKVESFIYRCVDSILEQSFQEFELILVDDGSPDNCGIICDEYAKKDNRIHVIHKQNGGLSDARNAGIDWVISKSDSQWITFIDSDDWIHPKYLEVLLNSALNNKCSLSVCSFMETDGSSSTNDEKDVSVKLVDSEQFFCDYNVIAIVAWGKLYRIDLFNKIRYPYGKIHEDEYVTYKLLFKNKHCAFVDMQLYYYYQNPNSIMNSSWSPKRIDVIEAFSERNEFFLRNHFDEAFIFGINQILVFIKWFLEMLITHNEYEQDRLKYYSFLKKHLRNALKKGNRYGLCNINDNLFLYEFAYPRFVRLYLYLKSFTLRFKRK